MPSLDFATAVRVDPPFPGLRPFESSDSHLFFGREAQVEQLLERLSRHRFLAVVGTSGSGKSSLVKAGLLPDLRRGYLVGATSRWRTAVMRPGNAPVEALAQALERVEALGSDPTGNRARALRGTSHGLIDAVAAASLPPGEALLLVVDQFEELFRYEAERGGGGDDVLFVSLLLEAIEAFHAPIYVVLTMRSDFLGDCARYDGLPEALNKSQYLVPRLSREQRQQAIEQPLLLAGADIEPGLVQLLLNDSGDDPDQLPVLQHALMRTYAAWKSAGARGPIGAAHYTQAGRMAEALNDHADEILRSFPAETSRGLVERLFRCLTTVEGSRQVRRPARLSRIFGVIGARSTATQDEVRRVIALFARPENSLLVAPAPEPAPEAVIDISHESLIRKWRQLQRWVQAEAKSVEWYRDLVRDVERGAAPWKDPDLARVEELCREDGWNQAWAEQYAPGRPQAYTGVEAFLRQSRVLVAEDARRQGEEAAREAARRQQDLLTARQLAGARLKARRWLTLALGLLTALLIAVVLFVRWKDAQEKASSQKFAEISGNLTAARDAQEKLARDLNDTQAKLAQVQDHGEKQALEQRLTALQRGYEQSTKQAREAQDRLAEAQKSQMGQTSDHGALVKQITDLQAQLKQEQQLRIRSGRPIVALLPPHSYVLLDQGPFADGTLGLAVEDLRRMKGAEARVYCVNGPAAVANVRPFREDASRATSLVRDLAKTTACPGRSSDGRVWCFVASREQTVGRTQPLGRLSYKGMDYEVTSVAWSQNAGGGPDVLTLLFTPSWPAPASAR
jgi:hypothetical protein